MFPSVAVNIYRKFNFRARQLVKKETPLHWKLLHKTCCSMLRRSQSTDFACAALQAVRILNVCETFHGIHVPLNFLFKFTGINLVQLNINPVQFYLIRLCNFCNIYMTNDVKFFEFTMPNGEQFKTIKGELLHISFPTEKVFLKKC